MQLPMVVVYRRVPDAAALAALRLPRQPLGKAATIIQFLAIGALVMGWPAACRSRWGRSASAWSRSSTTSGGR